jgi:hypothetical protein
MAGRAPELRDRLRMVDDRSGNEVRKIGHKQKIIRRTQRGRGAAERIDEESDLRKSVEGNSDRQRNHGNGPLRAGQVIKIRGRKPAYLKFPSRARSPQLPMPSSKRPSVPSPRRMDQAMAWPMT